MKKFNLMLWTAGLLLPISAHAQQWVDKAGLPAGQARNHPVSWAINGFGYAVTGATETTDATKSFFKYTPQTDSWEQLTDFPGPARSYSIGGVYQGKGYLGFGDSGNDLLNDLWRYDPATATWNQLASCPCSGRQHPSFTVNESNGKIYAGLGNNTTGNLKDWWEYDIATNTWTAKTDFPGTSRHHPFQFSIGNYSYTGLGHDDGQDMATKDMYRYDPANGTWQRVADAPGARIAGTQFAYKGSGFVLSGEGNHHLPSRPSIFWKYNPAGDSWQVLNPHPGSSLWAPGSFIIDSTLYVFGGVDRTDPASQIFFKGMWAFNLNSVTGAPVGIRDAAGGLACRMYPNPAGSALHLELPDAPGKYHLSVYTVPGTTVLTRNIESAGATLDVSALRSGIYFISIRSEDGALWVRRFAKK